MRTKLKDNFRYRGIGVWAVVLASVFIVCSIPLFFYNAAAAAAVLGIAVASLIVSIVLLVSARTRMLRTFYEFATSNDTVQNHVISRMHIPYMIVTEEGDILWTNEAYESLSVSTKRFKEAFPQIGPEGFKKILASGSEGVIMPHGQSWYRVTAEDLKAIDAGSEMVQDFIGEEHIWGLSMYDETELTIARKELYDQKAMVCLLYLDNYEEALDNVEAVRQSILTALIERKITRYFQQYDALLRKLEKDKYLAVIKQAHLEKMKEERFAILEEIKSVNIGNETSVTASVGMGLGGAEYPKDYEYARTAMDMALARGGDQAVVKDMDRIQYYGGRSQKVEKNTRVKSRMKAHALSELVETRDEIFIMGHRLGDIDCIGAAIGMYRAMTELGKVSHIVLNDVIASVKPFYEYFRTSPDYPDDLFIKGSEAAERMNDDSVLIVVDTNRKSISDEQQLIEKAKTIVVLDHHRQVQDYIAEATLSYVEPFASSASEMVAEILQYIGEGDVELRPAEADAIYAGIVLDTHNFTIQTGVRTFEAAAYLRKSGADITKVRKLFRDDIDAYKVKAEAIRSMEIIGERFAITVCPPYGESPTVLAAETANDLLEISEIQASFVLTQYEDTVFISARSIDEVNVQVIMEKLGGGGHMSIAGAQLQGARLDDARELVKETVTLMLEEGEL